MRLRSHLVVLVMAVLVPMILFAAMVVALFGRQQRADVERGATETARALLNAVDESLDSSVKVLQSLAASRALDNGDLRTFHAEARRVVSSHSDWFNMVLLSPDGQQIVNTTRDIGEPLPRAMEPASVATVVATSRPVVGDVTFGKLIGPRAGAITGDPDRLQQVV
jgi:hypothetical protein